jgi:Kef-type K+ transport system membrane component KefB
MNLILLVLQITVVLVVCRVVGDVFLKIGQPRVNGEMFAGILLGPSLLGWVWPSGAHFLFPSTSFDFLNALGQMGVVLFMFLAGLAINLKSLTSQIKPTFFTSVAGIGAPVALAFGLSTYLHPRFAPPGVSFTIFSLLLGAAMTIVAFPMLGKLLLERGLLSSQMGAVSMACSCVAGIVTWCMLAYIVTMVKGQSKLTLWLTFAGIALLFAVMFGLVRPRLQWFGDQFNQHGTLSEKAMAVMMVLVALFSAITGYLGLHPLFGAFLVGAAMPKDDRFIAYVTGRLEVITLSFLLPLYLAFSGLRTNVLALKGVQMWLLCAVIILVGILGKVVASALAAWASGMKLRDAAGLGSLMNMRGLICLIVLNIGLDLKMFNTAIFSMMVVMAVVNTLLTLPMFNYFCPREPAVPEPSLRAPGQTALEPAG